MRKIMMTLAAVLCCSLNMTVLTSCSVSDNPVVLPDPDPKPENLADVTIIFYGLGGSNLDEYLITNLRQLYDASASSYDNVKIAMQYKFSSKESIPHFGSEEGKADTLKTLELMGAYEDESKVDGEMYVRWMDPEGFSTFRLVLDPSQTLRLQAADSYLPQENCDFSTPDSLTNFINWAADQCPAKKYVLILSDHGGGYLPSSEMEKTQNTRTLLADEGHDFKQLTAKELARAIAAAKIRPNVIYYDACLMNTIEYQFELKDLTDYIVASTYVVPGPGGLYNALVDCLSGAANDLEYALEKYIEYTAKNWDRYYPKDFPLYSDITVTTTAKLDHLGVMMRQFTDRLCDTYQNGTDEQRQRIDEVTRHAVKVSDDIPSYDIAKYIASMMLALPEVYDKEFYNTFADSFNDCLVAQYTSQYLLDHNYQVDYSVVLGAKGHFAYMWVEHALNQDMTAFITTLTDIRYYEADGTTNSYKVINGEFSPEGEADYTLEFTKTGTWNGTLDSVYGQTVFDRTVGWSRWIYLNQQEPNAWCRSAAYAYLPEGDLIDNPNL